MTAAALFFSTLLLVMALGAQSLLVNNGIQLHDDSVLLIDLHQRIANDMVALYLATHQQPAAPVIPAEQMGMF